MERGAWGGGWKPPGGSAVGRRAWGKLVGVWPCSPSSQFSQSAPPGLDPLLSPLHSVTLLPVFRPGFS